MKIYASKKSIYPNRFNSEYHIASKCFIVPEDEQLPNFYLHDYFYITLYSQSDTGITITAQFGKQKADQPPEEVKTDVQQKQP